MQSILQDLSDYDLFILENKLEEAEKHFDKKKEDHESKNEITHTINVGIILSNLLIQQGRYDEALKSLIVYKKKLADSKNRFIPLLSIKLDQSFCELYNHTGEYRQAINISIQILNNFKEAESLPKWWLGDIHYELALGFRKMSDIDQALYHFSKAYFLFSSVDAPSNRLREFKKAKVLNSVGVTYWFKNEIEVAYKFINSAYDIQNRILPNQHPTIIKSINDLSLCEWGRIQPKAFDDKKHLYQEVLQNFDLTIDRYTAHFGHENHRYIANAYCNKGKIYQELKKYKKATDFYQKEIIIRKQIFKQSDPTCIQVYNNLIKLYTSMGEYEKAIAQAKFALTHGIKDYKNKNICDKQDLSLDDITSPYQILKTFQYTAETLLKKYKSEGKIEDIKRAHQVVKNAVAIVEIIRNSLEAHGSILFTSLRARPTYEIGLEIINLMLHGNSEIKHQIPLSKKYRRELKIDAFSLIENNKAILLLRSYTENIQKKTLYSEKRKQDALLKNMKDDDLHYILLKNIIILSDPNKSSNSAPDIESYQESLKNQKDYSKYKKYITQKYKEPRLALNSIQKKLNTNDAAVISYFVGDREVYAMFVSQNDSELFSLNIAENHANIEQFENLVKTFNAQIAKKSYTISIDDYLASAYELYLTLIAPLESRLNEISRIYIIYEDFLSLLSFEALICSFPKRFENDFYNLDYLINKFLVSYHFSATMLPNREDSVVPEKNEGFFSGFSPSYKMLDIGMELDDLPFAEKEVKAIVSLFKKNKIKKSRAWLKLQATPKNLFHIIRNNSIIHLTAHYSTGLSDGRRPGLIIPIYKKLNKRTRKLEFVGPSDIMDGVETDAHLVVLCCCATGIGKKLKGEGFNSLNRAFIFAGTINIVYTLFEIFDKDAYNISLLFYENILKGMPYATALSKAKKSILQKKSSIPATWAGYVFIGNQLHRALKTPLYA